MRSTDTVVKLFVSQSCCNLLSSLSSCTSALFAVCCSYWMLAIVYTYTSLLVQIVMGRWACSNPWILGVLSKEGKTAKLTSLELCVTCNRRSLSRSPSFGFPARSTIFLLRPPASHAVSGAPHS